MQELVVLVSGKNIPIDSVEKSSVHSANTPLHRGISVFLFNGKGKLLLQQRSTKKKTWPMCWSNSCCGHPLPAEDCVSAAKRRLIFELGISTRSINVILLNYRYNYIKYGVRENEICPVMVALTDGSPTINRDEVNSIKWISWKEWLKETKNKASNYSEWSVEQTKLLNDNDRFKRFSRANNIL